MSQTPDAAQRIAQILIIRHAEKHDDKQDPHLSDLGRRKARALARRLPVLQPWIGFLFAAASRPHTTRPLETLEPLSRLLGLPIDTRFDDENPQLLARELTGGDPRYAQGIALICWRHRGMAGLARALGATDAPDHWDIDIYDRLWTLTYGPAGDVAFRDEALDLTPGPTDV